MNKWYWLGPTILLALLIAFVLLAALSWRVSLRGLSVVERAWTGTSRLARWSGVEATESVTPLEHAARIDEALGTDKVAERLAESYGAVRFGRRTLESEAAEEIEVGWREIRSRLLRRLLPPGRAGCAGCSGAGRRAARSRVASRLQRLGEL